MTPGRPGSIIIAVGNKFRRDDGAGPEVASLLRELVPAGVTLIEESGEGAALLEAWKGAATAILVDAVQSGSPPGTIHRFDALAERIPSHFFHYSTHAFSVAEAVELGRTLNQLPPRLLVYGIEGKDFAAGLGLTAEVKRAASAVAAKVLDELRALG